MVTIKQLEDAICFLGELIDKYDATQCKPTLARLMAELERLQKEDAALDQARRLLANRKIA